MAIIVTRIILLKRHDDYKKIDDFFNSEIPSFDDKMDKSSVSLYAYIKSLEPGLPRGGNFRGPLVIILSLQILLKKMLDGENRYAQAKILWNSFNESLDSKVSLNNPSKKINSI